MKETDYDIGYLQFGIGIDVAEDTGKRIQEILEAELERLASK